MSPDGVVDKVLVVVKGFDNDNTEHPIDDLNTKYQPMIEELQADGWDIVVFDYVRGDIDIKQNAENLKHFIGRSSLVKTMHFQCKALALSFYNGRAAIHWSSTGTTFSRS